MRTGVGQLQRRLEQAVDHGLGHRVGHADAEVERWLAGRVAMLAQRGLELAAQVEDLVGVTQRHAAVVGQLELAAALAEQGPTQPVFQQLDLAGQRLRRGVQLFARLDDAAGVGRGPEVVQVLEVHGHSNDARFSK
jgi:hypothetical protein